MRKENVTQRGKRQPHKMSTPDPIEILASRDMMPIQVINIILIEFTHFRSDLNDLSTHLRQPLIHF